MAFALITVMVPEPKNEDEESVAEILSNTFRVLMRKFDTADRDNEIVDTMILQADDGTGSVVLDIAYGPEYV